MNIFEKFKKQNEENINQEEIQETAKPHGKEKGGYIVYPGYYGKVIRRIRTRLYN